MLGIKYTDLPYSKIKFEKGTLYCLCSDCPIFSKQLDESYCNLGYETIFVPIPSLDNNNTISPNCELNKIMLRHKNILPEYIKIV